MLYIATIVTYVSNSRKHIKKSFDDEKTCNQWLTEEKKNIIRNKGFVELCSYTVV